MDFTLSDEQEAIRATCREFAEQEIKPVAEQLDAAGQFPYDLVQKMAALGLFGLPFPEAYGGAGADFLSYCLAIEEISRADVSVGITMEAHTSLGATPWLRLWRHPDARHLTERSVARQWLKGLYH